MTKLGKEIQCGVIAALDFLYVSPYGGGVCCVAEYEEHRKGKDCK